MWVDVPDLQIKGFGFVVIRQKIYDSMRHCRVVIFAAACPDSLLAVVQDVETIIYVSAIYVPFAAVDCAVVALL